MHKEHLYFDKSEYFDAQNSSTKFKDNPVAKAIQEQKVAIDQATAQS